MKPACLILFSLALTLTVEDVGVKAETVAYSGSKQPESKVDSVIDMQLFRESSYIVTENERGVKSNITLINLNPAVNIWYLIRIRSASLNKDVAYHIENIYPDRHFFILSKGVGNGTILLDSNSQIGCRLPLKSEGDNLILDLDSTEPYVLFCNDRLYLRNQVKGHRTRMEAVTDLLRSRVPGGESLVGFLKGTIYRDAFKIKSRLLRGGEDSADDAPYKPRMASVNAESRMRRVIPHDLGIGIADDNLNEMMPGMWYPASNTEGVYISAIEPGMVSEKVLNDGGPAIRKIDREERSALAYLIAFDLDWYDVGFSLGTEHPGVEWAERVPNRFKNLRLPGPDGIGSIAPLVATGLVTPVEANRLIAVFTGGFKRIHGGFKYGELSRQNYGSHYGFVEKGVVLSTLQPRLATLYVMEDGSVDMKTWNRSDATKLPLIRYARQNGVPLIEYDDENKISLPGRLVDRWGPGNWSGSVERRQRTLRAGAAIQERMKKRFLIYGYFSSATPPAMARVFHAYGVKYAMHLDMNALEHTYLALFERNEGHVSVQHLVTGMEKFDKIKKDIYLPRFVGYSDNRDFFYLMKK